MATVPLIYLGDPILRAQAAPVADFDAEASVTLARDMVETMLAAQGIGLAAPQIGVGQRLIVFHVPELRSGEDGAMPLQILFNPVFTPLDDALEVGLEGCLSLPGLRGDVPRYAHIGYRGIDLAGQTVEREARGLHARVVQHEIDHLDGVMYLDRMRDFGSLVHESVIRRKLRQQAGEGDAQKGEDEH